MGKIALPTGRTITVPDFVREYHDSGLKSLVVSLTADVRAEHRARGRHISLSAARYEAINLLDPDDRDLALRRQRWFESNWK